MSENVAKSHASDLEARLSLASQYWQLQRYEACAQECDLILRIEPENAYIWNSKGLCLVALGKIQEAIACLSHAVTIRPDIQSFHLGLAQALQAAGSHDLAAQSYWNALRLNPQSPESLRGLAQCYFSLGIADEAVKAIDALAAMRQLSPEELLLRSDIFLVTHRADQALKDSCAVLAVEPNCDRALLLKGIALQQLGRHRESEEVLRAAIAVSRGFAAAYYQLVQSRHFSEDGRDLLGQLKRLSETTEQNSVDWAIISLASGKLHDDLGEYEEAMAHIEAGHRTLGTLRGGPYDRQKTRLENDAIIDTFDERFFEEHRFSDLDSDRPIFIVGLPRSGTTLIETILSSHSNVAAGGELSFWSTNADRSFQAENRSYDEHFAREAAKGYLLQLNEIAGRASHVTDKLPKNSRNVGLLHALFPSAKFIFVRRKLVDVALSFYMNMVTGAEFLHKKGDIVFVFREYERLMAHWRSVLPFSAFLDFAYEDLVSEPEGMTRKLLQFCGLEWEGACLRPEANERRISTASHWQARQPIYSGSVDRWRNYEPWLGEFRDLLDPSDQG